MDQAKTGWLWILPAAVVAGWSCLEIAVDLRANPGDAMAPPGGDAAACGPGLRINPDSDICEPCVVREPPAPQQCPCDFVERPGAFPFCEGSDVDYQCLSCPIDGNIDDCAAVADDDSVRNCAQLAACCGQLSQSPTPCCSGSETLLCWQNPGVGVWPNTFDCFDDTCCETSCTTSAQCAAFQSCDGGRCKPGCIAETEYCNTSCVCTDQQTPPL